MQWSDVEEILDLDDVTAGMELDDEGTGGMVVLTQDEDTIIMLNLTQAFQLMTWLQHMFTAEDV